jgi:hypothetical protein
MAMVIEKVNFKFIYVINFDLNSNNLVASGYYIEQIAGLMAVNIFLK